MSVAPLIEEIGQYQTDADVDTSLDATVWLVDGRVLRGHIVVKDDVVTVWQRLTGRRGFDGNGETDVRFAKDDEVVTDDRGTCEVPVHTVLSAVVSAAFSVRS